MKPCAILWALFLFVLNAPVQADEAPHRPQPKVIEMGVPRYPPMAAGAGISGIVTFLVRTDGHKIAEIINGQGPTMLVRELGKYLATWKFEAHSPEQFEIIFKMKVTHDRVICPPGEPDEVKLILPSYIEMTHAAVSECDPVITTIEFKPD